MILKQSERFNPRFTVVGCVCVSEGSLLLLKRHPNKPRGGTWCLPGGKTNPGETALEAIEREVYEETRQFVVRGLFELKGVLHVRYPEHDFRYCIYHVPFFNRHVTLKEDEHIGFQWVLPWQAYHMNLIEDEAACLDLAFL